MPSRASRLLASALDRVFPSGRRRKGRSYAWEPGSRWSSDWRTPSGSGGAARAAGPAAGGGRTNGPAGAPPAAAPTSVEVTVEGPVWDPTDPVVEGEIVEEPDAAARGGPGDASGDALDGDLPGDLDDDGTDGTDDGTAAGAAGTAPAAARHDEPRRLRDDLLWAGAIALGVLLVLVIVVNHRAIGDWLVAQRVQQTVRAFAGAWQGGELDRVDYDPASLPGDLSRSALAQTVADSAVAATAGLTRSTPDDPAEVELVGPAVLGRERTDGDRTATQKVRVRWRLDGRDWAYTTTVSVRQRGNRWRVVWTPQTVHPALRAGEGLVSERVQPPRAPIVAADGTPLVTTQTVHRVTFRSDALIRPYGDIKELAGLLGVDEDRLVDRVTSLPRGTTVEVATLRHERWARIADRVLDIKGVAQTTLRLPVRRTESYGRSLIGDVVPATPRMAAASGGRLLPGDLTGTSGLQRTYDERLRGRPGLRVVAVPLPGQDRPALAPRAVGQGEPSGRRIGEDLARPTPGQPLRLTVSEPVQAAAQRAVDGAFGRTSLVAVDTRSGAVLAVASNVAEQWDRPLLGTYPPGSTFKIVTAWALTGNAWTSAARLPCPASVTVGGQRFRNSDRRAGGVRPLVRQFAASCNTAFAGLGSRVTADDLARAARDLGIGVPVRGLGVAAVTGSVPPAPTPAAHAATLIGQSRVTVSPLGLAVATATVAGGRYRSPQLVLGVPRVAPTVGPPLDGGRLATLRSLMCEVVRSGTATALRRAPGGPVYGKTGTAQFGDPQPVGAHAWFTGYQGNVAFAVVVERGGYGAAAAVPVTMRFLRSVRGGAAADPAASCGATTAAPVRAV